MITTWFMKSPPPFCKNVILFFPDIASVRSGSPLWMNRFHKDRPDPCSLCSINIRKQLISYKDRPVKIDSDHLAGFFIIFHSRFMGIFYKIPLYCFGKGLHTRFLVIGYKAVSKPESPQLFKQFLCPVICRCDRGEQWYYRYPKSSPLYPLLCKASP